MSRLGDFFRKPDKPYMSKHSEGVFTGKQAREYAKNTKHCKARGCNNAPGGHQFRFPGAKELCTEHARTTNTVRTKKATESEAARKARHEENRRKFREVQDKRRGKK